jgi:corrinoid protein of di/trimethylamine methyltransferase
VRHEEAWKMKTEDYLGPIIEGIVKEEEEVVRKWVFDGLTAGIDPMAIINQGLTVGLRRVGDLFADEEIFLPGLVMSAQIVTRVLEDLKPRLKSGQSLGSNGVCLIGTVYGDIHDIGKSLVALLLSASGYEVVDLGKSVPTETFIAKAKEMKPHLIALSALLTTTMQEQRNVIESLERAGVRKNLKILVGGSPVSKGWAKEIGADGYAEDAVGAVAEANRVLGIS